MVSSIIDVCKEFGELRAWVKQHVPRAPATRGRSNDPDDELGQAFDHVFGDEPQQSRGGCRGNQGKGRGRARGRGRGRASNAGRHNAPVAPPVADGFERSLEDMLSDLLSDDSDAEFGQMMSRVELPKYVAHNAHSGHYEWAGGTAAATFTAWPKTTLYNQKIQCDSALFAWFVV